MLNWDDYNVEENDTKQAALMAAPVAAAVEEATPETVAVEKTVSAEATPSAVDSTAGC